MIYRIDVRTTSLARGGEAAVDPVGEALCHQIAEFGATVGPIETSRIFLVDTEGDVESMRRAAQLLIADPVVESADLVIEPPKDTGKSRIEIHLKPGVMDPVAASTEMALRDLGLPVREVRTGRAYLFDGQVASEQLRSIASKVLANGVIESVHFDAFIPSKFETGRDYKFKLNHVQIRDLSDAQLQKLSREGHLFLSLTEMKAVQAYYREQQREPTDIELETIAQTWSEHCVHKTLKSAVDVAEQGTGKTRRYENLIKDTIFASTQALMKRHPGFCLSVFKDNAGVVAFDETDAVCFKVETHNHPSAIEPYGGAATGAGGCIRDVLGTGLAARPIANTDIFCVAYPDAASKLANRRSQISDLPKGVIHPKRILQQVVAGVRDYGNRMGIPTVNGAVYFDDNYLGNPLVFCGCVGLIPRDRINKSAREGDAVVVMGGRTGRDGIHGATFSSAELTDTHADEFSHAVQIGNAITQKKMADVILQARDRNLFTAITDCGAGGLSSAVGEMGEKTGADVQLDKVPLKYAGLRYDEIWISEAQERMVLSVPQDKVEELLKLSELENVEATVIGRFGTNNKQLLLHYGGEEVGRLSMGFLHDGIPMPTRKAIVAPRTPSGDGGWRMESGKIRSAAVAAVGATASIREKLLTVLAHPNVASKHWIIRQYDHEVQGGSTIKPLVGPMQIGPSDASVLRPKLSSHKGVALACGLAPWINDPYTMAIAAIDEAVRNMVCVGADLSQTAILDNFCWPSVDDERTMGELVAACEACRDAALVYGIPFISGKDSLHNQFTNQETGQVLRIPRTLLISAMGVIDDVRRCITMDFKQPGSSIYLVAPRGPITLETLAATHRSVAAAIASGAVRSAHDISEGGAVTAIAEMCIASGLGAEITAADGASFNECVGCYIVEVDVARGPDVLELLGDAGVTEIGRVTSGTLAVAGEQIAVADMTAAWRGTLDW